MESNLLVSIDPPPALRIVSREIVRPVEVCRIPPLKVRPLPASPRLLLAPTRSVPALMLVSPVYVFVPESVSNPVPTFVSAPVPKKHRRRWN